MILQPESHPQPSSNSFVPAWQAVAAAQRVNSAKYQLIRQPDHARLSGELVERFAIAGAPPLTRDIVSGIALHDEGWTDFDCGRERLRTTPADYTEENVAVNAAGKPLCFLDIKAGDFLRAWIGSIKSAEAVAPIAGLMVSRHFLRLGNFGLGQGVYSADDAQQVREFLQNEDRRQRRLSKQETRSAKEIEYWTDVLQFCDLLSLYLCCGSQESVGFPQGIGPTGETIKLQVQDGVYVLTPRILAEEDEFSCEAHSYPESKGAISSNLKWESALVPNQGNKAPQPALPPHGSFKTGQGLKPYSIQISISFDL